MEAKFGGKVNHLFGPAVSDLKAVGKKSLEWDLNDWKWDGDLFIASPLNPVPSDCRSKQLFPVESEIPSNAGLFNSFSSCSDKIDMANEKGKRELEKRRRIVVVDGEEMNDESGSLNLKLGGEVYPFMEEGKSGKKTKLIGSTSSRAVCQVDDCSADLANAKDYHRRHKVCDIHSKATTALVGNVMQRFCQQCSRFHVLQEFDEGKRSCRRRLAGHNKRRRKTHPEAVVNGGSLNDERGSSYLLISLLRILSNMHANNFDERKDQDILSHLLRNLATLCGTINGTNSANVIQGSRNLPNLNIPEKSSDLVSNGPEPDGLIGSASTIDDFTNLNPQRTVGKGAVGPSSAMAQQPGIVRENAQDATLQTLFTPQSKNIIPISDTASVKASYQETTTIERVNLNNIDLNHVYCDSQECIETPERDHVSVNPSVGSLDCPLWMKQDLRKSSPPQTSANSDSTSSQSLSSSSEEAQSRTDRIVFKLFGKDPNDFPLALRTQILNWLSHSPTDIESYIRPGCIILTLYIRLEKSTWEKLFCDLSSALSRLLEASNDSFWRLGWVYTRVQDHVAFILNGQVVLDTFLPLSSHKHCSISSVKPIAVSASEEVQFTVKGHNISRATTRLLCALEGMYLIEESCSDLDGTDSFTGNDETQIFRFRCSIPDVIGRGFVEVEDHGLSSSFFPFIVAENDVCTEIRMLESAIDAGENIDNIQEGTSEKLKAKDLALDFIHEIGWLLHRMHLKSRLGQTRPSLDLFPFKRVKWLIEFSMDRDWCAVVKKLLGILFSGIVDAGEGLSIVLELLDLGLVHSAVKRNCRPMVELLLRYKVLDSADQWPQQSKFLFRPDAAGPSGLTPLHLAATRDGLENVLDALTNDPGLVGIEAWNSARDDTGLTPCDYARLKGHYSYIVLVQNKIKKNQTERSHQVVLDIPSTILDPRFKQKLTEGGLNMAKFSSFETQKTDKRPVQSHCKPCEQKLAYGHRRLSLAYRPATLSMVAIAAVCVCVALLFKSQPEVVCIFRPFRWESLKYGSS